ncbi:hypothetical protein CBS101457_003028 [Exobasidium rhododendri]|nr:hypothetical protein CBS101457_003028 [Exobasidium rhododendri]
MHYSRQSEEIIRNYFMKSQLSADDAHFLLSADDAFWNDYIRQSGLSIQSNKVNEDGSVRQHAASIAASPWQMNVPFSKRSTVIAIVRDALGVNEALAYAILKEPHVYPGFGRVLLESRGSRLTELIAYLKDGSVVMQRRRARQGGAD